MKGRNGNGKNTQTKERKKKKERRRSVPAEPVKKTFFPSSTTIFITFICSSLSTTSRTFSSAPAATPSRPDPTRTDTLGEKKLSIVNLGCFALRASRRAPCDLRLVPCFVVDLLMGESRCMVVSIYLEKLTVVCFLGERD